MSCHICAFAHSRLPFLCPTCARNRLYHLRLENAQIALEKEDLRQQIDTAASHYDESAQHSNNKEALSWARHVGFRQSTLQVITSRQATSLSSKETIVQHISSLKESIEAQKADILKRREVLNGRRSDAESAQYQLREREAAILTGIQNTTKRTEHLWHALHSKTAEARIFLCREVAHLYGLRQRSPKRNDPRSSYVLGGVSIVDLRDMNGKLDTVLYRMVVC